MADRQRRDVLVAATALPSQATGDEDRTGCSVILVERGSATSGGLRQGLWAAVEGVGVYRSTNAGSSWTQLYALPSTAYVRDAKLDSNGSLVIAVHNRNGASSLQRITTAGAVTSLNSPGGNASVAVHPTDPAQIVCAPEGISDGRVWRTTNSGGSWQSKTITVTKGPTVRSGRRCRTSTRT